MRGEKPQAEKKASQSTEKQVEKQVNLPIDKLLDKKQPAKPEAVDPNKGTDGMTSEQRKAFLESKKIAEESTKRIAELEKLVSDREATLKERDELRQRLEQREQEMEAVEVQVALERLKKSEEYRQTVYLPMQRLVGELGKIATSIDVPLETMLDAIENSDEVAGNAELSEIMERIDTLTVRKLERMISDIRDLNNYADHLHSNPSEAVKAAEFKEKERKEAESKKSKEIYSRSFDAVVDRFKAIDPSLFKENGEFTDEAKEAFDSARSVDWDTTPPDIKAYFAQAGHLLILKSNEIEKLREERDRLQDSIAKLSRKPSPSKGSPPAVSDSSAQVPSGQKPGDRFAAWREGR